MMPPTAATVLLILLLLVVVAGLALVVAAFRRMRAWAMEQQEPLQSALKTLETRVRRLEQFPITPADTPPDERIPEAIARLDGLDQRIGLLEQSFEITREGMRQNVTQEDLSRAQGEVRSLAYSLRKSLEDLREFTQKDAAQAISSLEERVQTGEKLCEELREEIEALRAGPASRPPAKEAAAEPDSAEGRINTRAPQDELVEGGPAASSESAVAPGLGTQRRGRPPRIISPEARARYSEVLALARQGRSPDAIAMMMSLDAAEIELMLAGVGENTDS